MGQVRGVEEGPRPQLLDVVTLQVQLHCNLCCGGVGGEESYEQDVDGVIVRKMVME